MPQQSIRCAGEARREQGQKLLKRHKELRNLSREELIPLLEIHLEILDNVLRPGMTTITWSSLNIDTFLEKYSESITHIESLFDRLCKILNHRVDETLAQVADVELCPLTPDNPVTIQAFSSILSTSAAEGADFLEKRSHAVEDAVQEVIEVFVKESAFNEEEEKSEQIARKPLLSRIHAKAANVERLANQRLHLERNEVSYWLDAQRLTLTAVV
ncbi:dynein heavy chain 5 [Trichonephila clavipes]|nr:dynein heavy chain 5 [Trichonephila clavipes]